jgi:hypothetical protein
VANGHEFELSRGMKPERAAQTFAAYLMGAYALGYTQHRQGGLPCQTSDGHWQLDSGNDFWLTVIGPKVRVTCRYENEERTLNAMVTLFQERHWLIRGTRAA